MKLKSGKDFRLENMGERNSFKPPKYNRKGNFQRCSKCGGRVLLPCVLCRPEAYRVNVK